MSTKAIESHSKSDRTRKRRELQMITAVDRKSMKPEFPPETEWVEALRAKAKARADAMKTKAVK